MGSRNLDQHIRPPLQASRDDTPHPSLYRGNPYSQDTRELVVQNRLNGTDRLPHIRQLQDQHQYPHPCTVDRYMERLREVGHARAYRQTGNIRAQREIEGPNLIWLALYRSVLPKATAAEVNSFLFEMNVHDPQCIPYSNSQINRTQQRLNLTKTHGSTTAFQALEPRNLV